MEQCQRKIEEMNEKKEKRKKKAIKITKIVSPIVAVFIAFIIVLNSVILPTIRYNNEIKVLSTLNVGDTFTFGVYEQDNILSNGKEDIEWLVLEKEDDKIFVISKYALDCVQYNSVEENVTWETCTLRKWLNGKFIDNAFNLKEKALIQETNVSADKSPEYDTNPGNATKDKIFLLSINEVNKYFSSDDERMCAATDYAKVQGAYTADNNTVDDKGTCWWWLRSPGVRRNYAARILLNGSVDSYGSNIVSDSGGVRPVMWISLE